MEPTGFAVFAEGLQKRYGKVKALDRLDLRIPGGKVWAVRAERGREDHGCAYPFDVAQAGRRPG